MKAVLVFDMPDMCYHCNFCRYCANETLQFDYYCVADGKKIDIDVCKIKPDWCPLRPLPDKKEIGGHNDDYSAGYDEGWNDCLKKITGEQNDSGTDN